MLNKWCILIAYLFIIVSVMAEKSCKGKPKAKPPGWQLQAEQSNQLQEREVVKVEFIITTYPELLEMVVVLLEGVYELNTNTSTS